MLTIFHSKQKKYSTQNLNCLIASSVSSSPISVSVAMLSSVTVCTLVHFGIELVQAGLTQLKIVFTAALLLRYGTTTQSSVLSTISPTLNSFMQARHYADLFLYSQDHLLWLFECRMFSQYCCKVSFRCFKRKIHIFRDHYWGIVEHRYQVIFSNVCICEN